MTKIDLTIYINIKKAEAKYQKGNMFSSTQVKNHCLIINYILIIANKTNIEFPVLSFLVRFYTLYTYYYYLCIVVMSLTGTTNGWTWGGGGEPGLEDDKEIYFPAAAKVIISPLQYYSTQEKTRWICISPVVPFSLKFSLLYMQ